MQEHGSLGVSTKWCWETIRAVILDCCWGNESIQWFKTSLLSLPLLSLYLFFTVILLLFSIFPLSLYNPLPFFTSSSRYSILSIAAPSLQPRVCILLAPDQSKRPPDPSPFLALMTHSLTGRKCWSWWVSPWPSLHTAPPRAVHYRAANKRTIAVSVSVKAGQRLPLITSC